VKRDERTLAAVPSALWLALGVALVLQLAIGIAADRQARGIAALPPAPSPHAIRLAGFGEAPAAARLTMLYLQSIDLGGGSDLPYQRFDYDRLLRWLDAILAVDPRSNYALFSAARVYAENPDPARVRQTLEFVYQKFLADPARRWPHLAQAAFVAKHALHDLPLARRYAAAIQRLATSPDVPLWVRQMEVFILEDMNELEAARIMLGGLIESGRVRDPAELAFLRQRLDQLEARLREAGTTGTRPSQP
jgi:hypothetical protein